MSLAAILVLTGVLLILLTAFKFIGLLLIVLGVITYFWTPWAGRR